MMRPRSSRALVYRASYRPSARCRILLPVLINVPPPFAVSDGHALFLNRIVFYHMTKHLTRDFAYIPSFYHFTRIFPNSFMVNLYASLYLQKKVPSAQQQKGLSFCSWPHVSLVRDIILPERRRTPDNSETESGFLMPQSDFSKF